jgi:hypothetical protein
MDDIGTLDDDDQHTNLGDILDIEDLQNSLGGIQNMYIGFEVIFFYFFTNLNFQKLPSILAFGKQQNSRQKCLGIKGRSENISLYIKF